MYSLVESDGINRAQHVLVGGVAQVVGGLGGVLVHEAAPQLRVVGGGFGGGRVQLQGLGLAQGPGEGAEIGRQTQQHDARGHDEQYESGAPGVRLSLHDSDCSTRWRGRQLVVRFDIQM